MTQAAFDLTLIVTGTRHATWADHRHDIESMMWFTQHQFKAVSGLTVSDQLQVRLVHGGARGTDSIADGIAKKWHWTPAPVPAKWGECTPICPAGNHRRWAQRGGEYCPWAGKWRNQVMLDTYGAESMVLLAFPLKGKREDSSGTWDMMERATAFGLNIVSHPLVLQAAQQQLW